LAKNGLTVFFQAKKLNSGNAHKFFVTNRPALIFIGALKSFKVNKKIRVDDYKYGTFKYPFAMALYTRQHVVGKNGRKQTFPKCLSQYLGNDSICAGT